MTAYGYCRVSIMVKAAAGGIVALRLGLDALAQHFRLSVAAAFGGGLL